MKKQNNSKLKICLIAILLIILSVGVYISLPQISYALNSVTNNIADTVGKITIPASKVTMNKEQIHEHRGHAIWAAYSESETKSYENAAGNTGIGNIGGIIGSYLSPYIPLNQAYGWVECLMYNTSIFCQEYGQAFPALKDRVLGVFHGDGNTDSNTYHVGAREYDYIEWCPELVCTKVVAAREEDYKEYGVEVKRVEISEADMWWRSGFKYVLADYQQYTCVRVRYTASPRDFDTVESYIFTYSLRNYYKYNPSQVAIWQYLNGRSSGWGNAPVTGMQLYRAAMAVNELSNPTKPSMSPTTEDSLIRSTGTVIDGDNYKVGPIAMNQYSYGWSEDVKDFSGQSSLDNPKNATILANKDGAQKEFFKGLIAGIIEAKVKLDNGTEIVLDKDNFAYSQEGTTGGGTAYYQYPTLAMGYEYPTPNSKFFILLPISECVGATKVEMITMTYKWHTADGNGGDLTGYYDELRWENSTMAEENKTTYHCDDSYGGYDCVHDDLNYRPETNGRSADYDEVNKHYHDFWCGTEGYCFDGESGQHRHCKGECKDCYGHRGSLICDCHTSHDYSCRDYYCKHTCDEDCTIDEKTGECKHYNSCNDNCAYDYSDCPYGGLETHDPWYSAGNPGCYDTDYCPYADLNYCIHGHINGKHIDGECKSWGADHIDKCYGPEGVGTRCNAHPDADGGGHRNCRSYYWDVKKEETLPSQKLIYVSDAQVYEHNEENYLADIPLVAKVEIDKYIYDVSHSETETGGIDTTYQASDARKELDEATKEANPVYVECDDLITYKLVLTNHSAFGVKVRVDDILPEGEGIYEFVSANIGGNKITDIIQLRQSIIQVGATSEASLDITIKVTIKEGVHENLGRIITRNGPDKDSITDPEPEDVDYVRTVDDDGPVVNHVEVQCNGTTEEPEIESRDWFILNNYNTFIDKFVYQYDQAKMIENNNNRYTAEESLVEAKDGDMNVLKESRENTSETTIKVSDGNVEDTVRTDDGSNEEYKKENPVNVEKYEKITYAIKVSNEATEVAGPSHETGKKPATQFRPTLIVDKLHQGLKYTSIKARIFNEDGTVKQNSLGANCTAAGTEGEYTIYNIECSDSSVIINPGEYIIFYMEVEVVQSNMYLHLMDNSAKLEKISNVNGIDVTDRNISEQQETVEYVSMKDLVISGEVWLDLNRNGLMDDTARDDLDKINNNINDAAMKNDIIVKLYQVGVDEAIRTTKTDENGLYTFGRGEDLTYYESYNFSTDYNADQLYQRVDKADGKDGNGNYTSGSQYLEYYIEYYYDGVLYKSTEFYSGREHLLDYGKYEEEYEIDSNAAELIKDREDFNKLYEYISYNVAYDLDVANPQFLAFQKDKNSSYLMEDSERVMKATSFVVEADQTIDYLWLYPYDNANNKLPETEYLKHINLGLELREDVDIALIKDVYKLKTTVNGESMEYNYNLNNGINGEITESEDDLYLKNYIVKQPYSFEIYESDYKYRVDQQLAQAVREYKGINGEDELNIEITFRMTIDNREVTDDDDYPGSTNTKLDVRIHEVLDLYDENFIKFMDDTTKDIVKMKTKDEEGYLVDKTISVAEAWMFKKPEDITDDTLVEIKKVDNSTKAVTIQYIKYGEAKAAEANTSDNVTITIQKYTEMGNASGKPLYRKNVETGRFVKAGLTISNTSKYLQPDSFYSSNGDTDASVNKVAINNNFEADGYNTLYITGMDDEVIEEGGHLDIYVKYVVAKAELEITITDQEQFNETKTTEVTSTTETAEGTTTEKVITVTEASEVFLKRALRLAEQEPISMAKKDYGRGTEGIGQVHAYSVWYNEDDKPASIVDKDSNAGNIGIRDASIGKVSRKSAAYREMGVSVDDIAYYEDTTYKTGIEIFAEGTENTKTDIETKYPDIEIVPNPPPEPTPDGVTPDPEPDEDTPKDPIIRKITGVVWDDARSEVLGTGDKDAQYIGNGLRGEGTKQANAKDNANVEYNYKTADVTEDNDITVRNAKVEFIEIVQVPVRNTDGTIKEIRYYEEVLTDVTWEQVQSTRTDENGEYELSGMRPGTYIVRFTYGDTVEENVESGTYNAELEAQKDMLIFNGQDYKSTKYNPYLADTENDVDKIIIALEQEKVSDARDDEIRRLEVNAYSEVMTNKLAEILKGVGNGTVVIKDEDTGNPIYNVKNTGSEEAGGKNSVEELKALTDNTYMVAETREFLIKTEKLSTTKSGQYLNSIKNSTEGTAGINLSEVGAIANLYYNNFSTMNNEDIFARNFVLENVDFGIEYRPESEISLIKEINEIKLIPQGKENDPLVHLFFNTEEVGGLVVHTIDEEKSIGFEKVQFVTNTYSSKPLINNLMSEEYVQGLVYLQVDKDILQGCTVEIIYGFDAENQSEVDRISTNLNEIRYKENAATDALADKIMADYGTVENVESADIYDHDKYTASGTGRNVVFIENYRKDGNTEKNRGNNKEGLYRITQKHTTDKETGDTGYFGRFAGYSYYTGELGDADTVSSLKFDKILDYVDTGLVYEPDSEQTDVKNKLWARRTAEELIDYVAVLNAERIFVEDTVGDTTDPDAPEPELVVTNGDGEVYKYLVVSVDDRTSDEQTEAEVNNYQLSKFLLPKVLVTGYKPDEATLAAITDEQEKTFSGNITLELSKVLNPEEEGDDMTYENMAEIVQFTTLTGRRTNFATTIGNANIQEIQERINNKEIPFDTPDTPNSGSIEFMTATLEPDTSATETVTLIPPTGLMRNRKAIVSFMQTAKTSVEVVSIVGLVVAIIAVVGIAVLFVVRKFKKRRIV